MPSSMLQETREDQKAKDEDSSDFDESMEDRSLNSEEKQVLSNIRRGFATNLEVDSARIRSFSSEEWCGSSGESENIEMVKNQCRSEKEEEFIKDKHTCELRDIDQKSACADYNIWNEIRKKPAKDILACFRRKLSIL